MNQSILKYISSKSIRLYFIALVVVSVIYMSYMLKWYWMILGIVAVCGFFYYFPRYFRKWSRYSPKLFEENLFKTSLVIRIVYVIFSYLFYLFMTGKSFEFEAADSWIYHLCGEGLANGLLNGDFNILERINRVMGKEVELSDSGYITYLGFIYALSWKSILLVRLLKSLMSAWMCVLIYRLATRNFGDNVGRLAAVFCMLMPNLIYYCGLHLKEVEMTFLTVLFIERGDLLLRQSKINIKLLLTVLLVGLVLFTFRTVLGAVSFLALFLALVLSSRKIVGTGKKIVLGVFVVMFMGLSIGDRVSREVEEILLDSSTNQSTSMAWRAEREGGNSFAKYAGAAVFAPMIFTIPFPTAVETPDHENQRMIHGGNFVKNITSFFTIFALFTLFMSGDWRKHVLPLAFICGYLLVIAMSAFAHSERFHMPALPFALMFAAYGISKLEKKHQRWFSIWLGFMFVAFVAWSWFKLAGRGL